MLVWKAGKKSWENFFLSLWLLAREKGEEEEEANSISHKVNTTLFDLSEGGMRE